MGWLRFLKPNNPAEALALIGVGVAIGTGGGKVFDAITAQDPWSERADRVCLRRGDEYLSLGGPRLERLRGQIRVTAAALSELSEIRSSVPTESALAYNGLLADKAGVLRALREELTLAKMRKPTAPAVEQRRERQAAYEQDALGLGLAVCGQGTGEQ